MVSNRLCIFLLAAPLAVSGFVAKSVATPRLGATALSTSPLDEFKIPVTKDDVRFPSMLVGFNQRFKANKAKAVYLVRTPEECAQALDDILDNYEDGVKVRSGGHCYENFVMSDATKGIIDVGLLQDWGKDDKGYYLSTGETNWSAFKKIFNRWGVILPGGSCYSVGLGGHVSGGGDGIMSRLYGTTVDMLTGIEIVVKDDANKPAYVKYVGVDSEGDDADLFWACKGAGNGNFGIITKYYFDVLPKAPQGAIITNIAFKWGPKFNAATLKQILDKYVEFASRNDNRESSAKFQIFHEAAGESVMTVHTAYFDQESKNKATDLHIELEEALKKFYPISAPSGSYAGHAGYWSRPARNALGRGRSGKSAYEDTFYDFPFYDATQTMNTSGPNQRGKYKSAYMKEKFPLEQVEAMIKNLKIENIPDGLDESDMKQSLLQIDCFGGRINDFTQEDTALGQRSYVVKLQFQTYWVDEGNDDLHLKWIRDFYHEDMYGKYDGIPDPQAEGGDMFEGCYYNYPDADLNDYKPSYSRDKALRLYFLENYEENPRNLVKVKRRWDPNDYFNHAQSIPVKDV